MISIFCQKDGKQLAYTDAGRKDGYPILVQHGLIASIEDVELFDRLTQAGVRVISIARPGYGESSPAVLDSYADWAKIISPLLEELQLSKFNVLGCSSGAPFSYALGAMLPSQVGNLYILSGLPALYDEEVLALWPYPPIRGKSVVELGPLAKELFFSWVYEDNILDKDVRDSMNNDCFGVAQDLRLRFLHWGFSLAGIPAPVFMRQSKEDGPYQAAVRTAGLLPHCDLQLTATGPHFSPELLNDFIETTILKKVPSMKA